MLFLHSHGVSTSRAVRIFKTYGEQAIENFTATTGHAVSTRFAHCRCDPCGPKARTARRRFTSTRNDLRNFQRDPLGE
jgi:hypothetical protein